ncbi:hypothetical protein L873DRAFT_472957 [Choiromyces venosus 120613-1]|uniref:Cytochrome oxidase subunit I profile domain-containing protein n=1 Tax=Choiromyces venosus 120613-1 TaxID=1336337 RepID=A0A3N4J122_9PEZI|nr:hypothetical protein L873DRAFT_472957 [Choiromyces venosus 120613-1]
MEWGGWLYDNYDIFPGGGGFFLWFAIWGGMGLWRLTYPGGWMDGWRLAIDWIHFHFHLHIVVFQMVVARSGL